VGGNRRGVLRRIHLAGVRMKDLDEIAEWLVYTCRFYGASVSTAHAVAGVFIRAIEQNRQR
jgi:hypothetical protein